MPLRLSAGLRNGVGSQGALADILRGGKILVYSGAQPSTAEAAPTGTLLVTLTDASGAHTAEVRATGSVALTGGGAGSLDTLTVDGKEIMGSATAFVTDLATTAQKVVDKINSNPKNLLFRATRSGNTINIKSRRGLGALANGWVVASTATTITKTDTNMSGGVDSVNGLKFEEAAAGVLAKKSDQVWSGVAVASGTAGWFRFMGAEADSGALDSTEADERLDGTCATSGGQMNMSSTTITSGATQTLASFTATLPAS